MKSLSPRLAVVIGLVASGALAAASSCSRSGDGPKVIDGAGATLPYPLYAKWSTEFARLDTSVRVNYQPLGSGAGIRQTCDGVIDFGATDEPMTDEQMKSSPVPLVHVPMTIGAVVVTYNVPGVKELKLTPAVVADVFRGAVRSWDDPRVRETNPNITLPAKPITVVHRADGSGTSATFTTFLSKSSDAWRADVGAGVSPRFPIGVGARGNDGVTAYVKATPYAIGYVELAYARQAKLPIALVKNRAGSYVEPTLAALDRAAQTALPRMPDDLRLSIVDSEDEAAYPIAALSFLVIPRDAENRPKAEALARFVWWGLHDGQRYAADLGYAPLPPEIVTRATEAVRGLRAEGKPIILSSGGVTGGAERMTQRALATPPRLPPQPPRSLRFAGMGKSGSADRTFGALGAGAAGALGLVLIGVAASVARIAWPSIQASGFSFVTTSVWDPSRGVFGALAFVWGTILTSTVALILAVPIGLGVALFLTDLGPRHLRKPVSSLVELLAAIPSVVYGLWAALVLAPILRTTVQPALAKIGGPMFRGPNVGFGILCASLVLAIMLLPTIASVSRDVLRAVPSELREGALALGATPWDAVRLVVLPHARHGVFGAILLGVGRAVGETMAVAAVVGSRADISTSLFAPGYTMSSVIANEFPVASSELHIAALAEVGLLLFVVTVAFNVAARILVARSNKSAAGAQA